MTFFDPATRARLREMLEKATPGPWEVRDAMNDRGWIVDHEKGGVCACEDISDDAKADAVFIAAARNVLPGLLDALDEREAKLAKAEALVQAKSAECRAWRLSHESERAHGSALHSAALSECDAGGGAYHDGPLYRACQAYQMRSTKEREIAASEIVELREKLAAATAAKEAAEQALSTAGLRCLDCERLVRKEPR